MEARSVYQQEVVWVPSVLAIAMQLSTVAAMSTDWVATVGVVGLVVTAITALTDHLMPHGLFRRPTLAEMGTDGIQLGERFIPWQDVRSIERGTRRGYAQESPQGVTLKVHGDEQELHLKPTHRKRFIKEALRRRADALTRQGQPDSEPHAAADYRRGRQDDPRVLVRVATDGSETVDARAEALERLDAPQRDEVHRALADRRLR